METLISRLFRRRRSKACKVGRPRIPRTHIAFIRRISSDHVEWGEDRIAEEIDAKFGFHHSARTIRRCMMPRHGLPRAKQTWRTFIQNHAMEAPSASPYLEMFMRTLRHEALDHFIFLGADHICRVVFEFIACYNGARPSQAIRRTLGRSLTAFADARSVSITGHSGPPACPLWPENVPQGVFAEYAAGRVCGDG